MLRNQTATHLLEAAQRRPHGLPRRVRLMERGEARHKAAHVAYFRLGPRHVRKVSLGIKGRLEPGAGEFPGENGDRRLRIEAHGVRRLTLHIHAAANHLAEIGGDKPHGHMLHFLIFCAVTSPVVYKAPPAHMQPAEYGKVRRLA